MIAKGIFTPPTSARVRCRAFVACATTPGGKLLSWMDPTNGPLTTSPREGLGGKEEEGGSDELKTCPEVVEPPAPVPAPPVVPAPAPAPAAAPEAAWSGEEGGLSLCVASSM
jgi:hypothetical protein